MDHLISPFKRPKPEKVTFTVFWRTSRNGGSEYHLRLASMDRKSIPDEIANDPYYFQTSIMNHYFSWPTERESPMNDESI
jgi:hypothetical protein